MQLLRRLLRLLRHPLLWILAGPPLVLGLGWLALLRSPALLFPYAVREQGLVLRSDKPFSPEAGRRILREVQARVDAAPWGSPGFPSQICIAQSEWRVRLCLLPHPMAIGISYPFVRNVFIRTSRVERDRVVHREGWEVGGYFTLTHVIAHELGHVQMYRRLGFLRTMGQVPEWIREGYAEYAGGISDFSFEADARAFLAEAASMQSPRPGVPPYRRLHLLMAFLLEKQGWTMERIAREHPEQAKIEAVLRAWLQARPQSSNH